MAGDINPNQLRFIASDGLQLGRTFFERDGDLHASEHGGFCPFPHPPEKRYALPRVDAPGYVEVSEQVFLAIQSIMNNVSQQDKHRAKVRRFKANKVKCRLQRK